MPFCNVDVRDMSSLTARRLREVLEGCRVGTEASVGVKASSIIALASLALHEGQDL